METDSKQTTQAHSSQSTAVSIAYISGHGTSEGTIIPAAERIVGPFLIRDQRADFTSMAQPSLLCRYAKQYGCSIFKIIHGKTSEIFGFKKEHNKDIPDEPPCANPQPVPQHTAHGCGVRENITGFCGKPIRCSFWKCVVILLYIGLVVLQIGLGAWGIVLVNQYCTPDASGNISLGNITIPAPLNRRLPAGWMDGFYNDTRDRAWNTIRTSDPPEVVLRKQCFRLGCSTCVDSCCGVGMDSPEYWRPITNLKFNSIGAIVCGVCQLLTFPVILAGIHDRCGFLWINWITHSSALITSCCWFFFALIAELVPFAKFFC